MPASFSRARKIFACEKYLQGNSGYNPIAREIGCTPKTLIKWVREYREKGRDAFKPPKRPRIIRHIWRNTDQLTPREIANIRYGMKGLTNAQVGALYGRTPGYISMVRNHVKGPRVAKPLNVPKFDTLAQANDWFVHKAIKTLEAWTAMLDEIEQNGDDADISQHLEEADYEGGVQSRGRRAVRFRKSSGSGTPEHSEPATAGAGHGDGAGELPAEVRASAPADPGAVPTQLGASGAGSRADGADRTDSGLILRRRR